MTNYARKFCNNSFFANPFLIVIFNFALLLANYDGLEEFYGLKNS